LLGVTLAGLLAQGLRAQVSPTFSPELVDSYISEQIEKRHIPGASVAVVRDGKILLAKGYGLANAELNVPATEHTVYQLASVTKPFTATAVMVLVEGGKLGLDDSIGTHLQDLPEAWRGVTVRQLLSHTSGIKSYTSVPGFQKTVRKDFAKREILDMVTKEPAEFAPGEKWSYCNTGFFLLGMLIEEVSGQSYPDFMLDRIFKPAGMEHTRANDLRAVIANRAQGYAWTGKELRNGEPTSPTQPFAAGMLVSTVADMAKWGEALDGEKIVKKSSIEQMWAPATLNDGTKAQYGLGWGIATINGHRRIGHGGGIGGFSTEYARYPDDGLTVVVLTNLEGGDAGFLARGIAGLIIPELAPKREDPIDDTDPETTGRLRRAVLGAVKGSLDPELFADDAYRSLQPRVEESKERTAQFGELKTFSLLERTEGEAGLELRYRAEFENETAIISFGVDKEGKIRRIGLRPAD
jgi:CubicO group peptidase (beta-lactamase class C family)